MKLLLTPCLALLAGCASELGSASLPILSQRAPFVPVEGLEHVDIADRARGAILSADGERPIAARPLPPGESRKHAVRGEVVALAGPAGDGRFVYAVEEEGRGLRLRRAALGGRDLPVARLLRPVHALSISADASHATVLAPFADRDPRSRGGVLRELLLVDLETGVVDETAIALWPWPPAWLDARRIAVVTAADAGVREVRVLDLGTRALGPVLAGGEAVLVDPESGELIVAARDDRGEVRLARVPPAGGPPTDLLLRGVLAPLGVLPGGILAAFAAPTLGTEQRYELSLLAPARPLGTIKLYELATGRFTTIERAASSGRLWSAGGG